MRCSPLMCWLIIAWLSVALALLDKHDQSINPPRGVILDPMADHTADSRSIDQSIEQSIDHNKWIDREEIDKMRSAILEKISQLVDAPTDDWLTPTETIERINDRFDHLPNRQYTKAEMAQRHQQLIDEVMQKKQ